MGSDGLFDPPFSSLGSHVYDSIFPVNPGDKKVTALQEGYTAARELFGAPSYVATQVVAGAIDRACKDGKATRAEVRAQIKKTKIPAEGLAARPAASRSTATANRQAAPVRHLPVEEGSLRPGPARRNELT